MPANRPFTARVSGTYRAVERLYAVAYKIFKNPLCSTRCSKSFGVKYHTFFFRFGVVTCLGQMSLCVPLTLVAVMGIGAAELGGTSQERISPGVALLGCRLEVFPPRPQVWKRRYRTWGERLLQQTRLRLSRLCSFL